MLDFVSSSPEDYHSLCDWVVQQTSNQTLVLALHGTLGAGKTTFVQWLGQTLGVTDTITSPTFTILSRYATTHEVWHTLYHMDAYRITSLTELRPLDLTAVLATKQAIVCIEWAELITAALPAHTIHFSMVTTTPTTRRIMVESHAAWLLKTAA